MLSNEHAPEPAVPTIPRPRPRSDGGCPGFAATGLLIAVTFVAGVGVGRFEPMPAAGSSRCQPGCGRRADRGRRRRLRADPRGVGPAPHEKYVGRDTLDDRELAYGAIDGLADAVGDTGHTDFMTPEDRTSRNDAVRVVRGSASSSTARTRRARVVTVFHDSPADKAGLRTGDVILEVDGVPAAGSSLDDVVGRIRGEAGTAVELTVRAGEDGTPRTLKIVRGEVEIDAVSWTVVPGTTTGLLRIEQFSNGVAEDVQTALQELRKEGADRLVLDSAATPAATSARPSVPPASSCPPAPSTSNATPRARRRPRRSPGRRVDRPAADRAGRRGQRVRVGDRVGRPPGQRPRGRRRDDVRHRHGPRRIRARGRFGAAHRDRRVADPRRAAHLARGHRAGRRGGPGDRGAPDAPDDVRDLAPASGVHRGRAARARAGADRGD